MRRSGVSRGSVGAVIVVSLVSSGAVLARERNLRASQVPSAVHEAISRNYPQAKVVAYSEESENGVVSYEVTLRREGHSTDVEVSPDGRILVQEERIGRADLPSKVTEALAASEYSRGHIERIERTSEPKSGNGPRFEILVRVRTQAIEVTFDQDGHLVRKEVVRSRG